MLRSHTPSNPKVRDTRPPRAGQCQPATMPAIGHAADGKPSHVMRSRAIRTPSTKRGDAVLDRVQEVDEQPVRRGCRSSTSRRAANQSSMPTTQASGNRRVQQTSPIAATTAAPTSQASRRGQGLRSARIGPAPVGSEMPTSVEPLERFDRHSQRSSTSAAITRSRSTTPTTWSPSTTRIGRSDDRRQPAINSCTIVSADTSPA